ncbi:MAG: PaaI family thioesterase [Thermodesulfovibrio sp.]|uniref:PaaI family thioesterase n=1 Tax=unclassified Thermodesulfovibrio TaxID=2645936 RepID=UPI00083AC5B0|nr:MULTISPECIES: PaaI family thioesterase [unclassified Thermodesulfovibrio]MDI1471263.1 PaaI family thioesterase [Thermodesulfovibrio sp. 1176]MDI6714732.1 PaaI family thioesterase [Thermodesulfovibrio sp.]
MMKTEDYCFVCGSRNPKGIKAVFNHGQGMSFSELTLSDEYQGWSGIIHGGIISALLDEACVYAGNSLGFNTVTAELKVRFKNSVAPHEKIFIEAKAEHKKSKLIEAKAWIKKLDGSLVAEAESKLIIKEKKSDNKIL